MASWTDNIANTIDEKVKNVMGVPEMQNIVNLQPKTYEHIDGSVKVSALAAQINLIFQKQKNLLVSIRNKAQELSEQKDNRWVYNAKHDGDELSPIELKDLSSKFGTYPIICETNTGEEYICGSEPVEISLNFSAFKVPSHNTESQIMIEDLARTEQLDEIFIQNHDIGPSNTRYQYFSSANGVLRYFPASPWEKERNIPNIVNKGSIDNIKGIRKGTIPLKYDARLTPWFASAISGPKNVVIIFDIASSYGKDAVLNILQTISRNDYFTAIYLSSDKDIAPFTLGSSCFGSQKLARGLPKNIKAVEQEVQNLEISGTQVLPQSLSYSFNLAVTLLEQSSLNECYTVFVVIAEVLRSSYQQTLGDIQNIMQNFRDENIVKIFTFADGSNGNHDLMKQIACEFEGTYDAIEDSDDAAKAGLYYFNLNNPFYDKNNWYLSYGYGLREDLYIYDISNEGMEDEQYFTITTPIFMKVDNEMQLLGVAGVDFDMYSIKNILDAGVSGESTTPILVNHEGDALYHPLQTQYKKLGIYGTGRHIINYEQSEDFATVVLPGLLQGETEQNTLMLERPLPKGDAAVNGIELVSLEMTFFSQPVADWPVYIALGTATEDLTETILTPSIHDTHTVLWRMLSHYSLLPEQIPSNFLENLSNYYKHILSTSSPSCIYNADNCAAEFVNISQLYTDTKKWSSIVDYIVACDGNCDPTDVPGTCSLSDTCKVLFYNCKNDHIPGVTNGSWCDLNGAPSYMCSGSCVCEKHRWPLGQIARWPIIGFAPKCWEDPTSAFLRDYSVEFSGSVHAFVNRFEGSVNLEPVLTSKCWRDASVKYKYIDNELAKDVAGLHDATIWTYTGTAAGTMLLYPGQDVGPAYDPTRRPWYRKAMGVKDKWKYSVSNPYIDAFGGGLMNTFSAVVFEKRELEFSNTTGWAFGDIINEKIWGVKGWDMLYSSMNGWVSTITGCATLSEEKNVYTHTVDDPPMCFLLDESGLLLTHTDFMITEADSLEYVDLTQKEGGETGIWPIEHVFVGEKEPALATQLIETGFLVHKTALSEVKDAYLSWFEVDVSVIPESGVLSGKIADQKCYKSAETSWYVSHVRDTNVFLVVVENYEYTVEGAARTGDCSPVDADPAIPIEAFSCEAINSVSSVKGKLSCNFIPYSAAEIEMKRPTDSKSSAGTGKCAEIDYPSWGTPTGKGIASVTIILIFAVSAALAVNVHFREKSYILRMSSSTFCILMEFGCILGYFAALLFIFQPSKIVCHLRLWMSNLAFVLIFSPLLAKTWRVHKLFNNPRLRKIRMRDSHLLKFVLGMLCVFLIFLIVCSSSQVITVVLKTDPNDSTVLYTSCHSPYIREWIYCNLVMVGSLVIFGVFLCVETRQVKAEFNESTQIAISIYNIFFMGILITPLLYTLDIESEAQVILISLGFLSAVTVTWVTIMLPKFLKIKWKAAHFRDLERKSGPVRLENSHESMHC